MKWKRGRQKDSYYIRVSVTDCKIMMIRKEVPKKFWKTLDKIIQDFAEVDDVFVKQYGRHFNTNVDIKTGKQI